MHVRAHRHGRAEHLVVEHAAGAQDGVADDFGVEALDRFAPIESVFGIALVAAGIAAGGLTICGGGHDQFVQAL